MDIAIKIFLVLHLVGWAMTLGGALASMKTPKVTPGMLHGVLTALVTGILMVGLHEMGDGGGVDNVKIAVKLLVALAVTVMVILGRRNESVSTGYLGGIAGLVVVNVAIAVLW